MTQRFRHRVGLTAVLAAIIGLVTIPSTHDTTSAADWKPADPPSTYVAGPGATHRDDYFDAVCTTSTQLDCTESVAAYINNEWVAGTLTGRTDSGSNGICCLEWKIPGLRNEDTTDLIMTRNLIKYTGNVFNSVQIHATTKDGFKVAWESGSTTCTTNKVNGICYREGNLQEGVKFRMVIRSSWVLPTAVSAGLSDMKTTIQYLSQSGATKITFEGIPTYTMGVSSDSEGSSTGVFSDPNGKGSWGMLLFNASTVDGRFYPIKKECNEKPTIVTGTNGYGMSIPSFANGQLDLKVQSPHFRPDGKTVHNGLYEAVLPLVTAECLWGKAINSASQLKIEVFETASGETKTASTSISVSGESLLIRASGFSYSIPTIRVRLAEVTTTTSSSTTTTSSSTTEAPTSTVNTPVVAAPKNVKVTTSRQIVKTTFTKATGVSYSATAKKGKTTARFTCKTIKQTVTCTSQKLARGSWILTVTPSKNGTKGAETKKSIKIT
jgi:hypothetical protein